MISCCLATLACRRQPQIDERMFLFFFSFGGALHGGIGLASLKYMKLARLLHVHD